MLIGFEVLFYVAIWLLCIIPTGIQFESNLNFVHNDPIDQKLALSQVKAWCWTGNMSLPYAVLNQIYNTTWCH